MTNLAAKLLRRDAPPAQRQGYLTLYSYGGPRRRRRSRLGRSLTLLVGAVAIGVSLALAFNLLVAPVLLG